MYPFCTSRIVHWSLSGEKSGTFFDLQFTRRILLCFEFHVLYMTDLLVVQCKISARVSCCQVYCRNFLFGLASKMPSEGNEIEISEFFGEFGFNELLKSGFLHSTLSCCRNMIDDWSNDTNMVPVTFFVNGISMQSVVYVHLLETIPMQCYLMLCKS